MYFDDDTKELSTNCKFCDYFLTQIEEATPLCCTWSGANAVLCRRLFRRRPGKNTTLSESMID
jgi:hypothetical protein